jgi:hypothetical protein
VGAQPADRDPLPAGHDGELLSDALAVFLRAVQGWYRKQARKAGHPDTRCGSVTFAQRFGSALNLNPHFDAMTG